MKDHPLRTLFNKLRWTERDLNRFIIRFIHRGAPEDRREINFSEVDDIGKGWFGIRGEESPIPFHRILEVVDVKKDLIIWRNRKKGNHR